MKRQFSGLLASMVLSLLVTTNAEAKIIKYPVKDVPDATFNHAGHVTRNRNCTTCHNAIYNLANKRTYTMADMVKGQSCGVCHNDKKAFGVVAGNDCSKCHSDLTTKTLKYNSEPATDAVFSHDFHSQLYSCYDCHTKKFDYRKGSRKSTMAEIDNGKSCGICHNGKEAFASTGDCQKCHIDFKPGQITFKNRRGTITGHFSHEFHGQIYGCTDCHTQIFPYGGGKEVTMQEMEQGKSCGACHDGNSAFAVTGDCAKCHFKN